MVDCFSPTFSPTFRIYVKGDEWLIASRRRSRRLSAFAPMRATMPPALRPGILDHPSNDECGVDGWPPDRKPLAHSPPHRQHRKVRISSSKSSGKAGGSSSKKKARQYAPLSRRADADPESPRPHEQQPPAAARRTRFLLQCMLVSLLSLLFALLYGLSATEHLPGQVPAACDLLPRMRKLPNSYYNCNLPELQQNPEACEGSFIQDGKGRTRLCRYEHQRHPPICTTGVEEIRCPVAEMEADFLRVHDAQSIPSPPDPPSPSPPPLPPSSLPPSPPKVPLTAPQWPPPPPRPPPPPLPPRPPPPPPATLSQLWLRRYVGRAPSHFTHDDPLCGSTKCNLHRRAPLFHI